MLLSTLDTHAHPRLSGVLLPRHACARGKVTGSVIVVIVVVIVVVVVVGTKKITKSGVEGVVKG